MFTPWRREFVRDAYIMILSSEIFKQKSSSASYKKKSDFDFHLIKLHSTKTKDLTTVNAVGSSVLKTHFFFLAMIIKIKILVELNIKVKDRFSLKNAWRKKCTWD